MRCEAHTQDTNKQCKFSASVHIHGHHFCGNHARRAQDGVDILPVAVTTEQPAAIYQRDASIIKDLIISLSPTQVITEIGVLREMGANEALIARVLDVWRGAPNVS